MGTLGIWLGPTLAVVVGAAGVRFLGWFQPRSRRRVALRRIAERLAAEDSQGYGYKHGRYLEHYLGGREWLEEWEKSDIPDGNGGMYDARGPAPRWWQRLGKRLAGPAAWAAITSKSESPMSTQSVVSAMSVSIAWRTR